MNWFAKALLITGGLIVGREVYLALGPTRWRRQELWRLAQARATALQKPLFVVGNPEGLITAKLFGRDYDCGDLCLDKLGCGPCANWLQGDLVQLLSGLPDNAAVVYVGSGLECESDLGTVLAHLDRVSGGHLFISHTEALSLAAWFSPGAQQRLLTAPPREPYVHYKRLPWARMGSGEERITLPRVNTLTLGPARGPQEDTDPDVIDVPTEE